MTVFRGIDSVSGGDQVATAEDIAAAEAAAAASAAEAAASAAAALVSEGLADADATATAADVVLTNADVVLTGLDVVATNADVVSTNADVVAADASAAAALVSENAAAASAATIPTYDSTTGEALNFVRLNAGETSMEFRTPAEMLADIGSGDMLNANNLANLASASTSRSNLGVAIGSDVQGYDADTAKTDFNQTWTGRQDTSFPSGSVRAFDDNDSTTHRMANLWASTGATWVHRPYPLGASDAAKEFGYDFNNARWFFDTTPYVGANAVLDAGDVGSTVQAYDATLEIGATKTSRKNVIINGNFDLWQRGTSFAAIANADFSADRFAYHKSGAAVHTVSRSTDTPTQAQSGTESNYSLLMDCTTADASIAAGDFVLAVHRIEGDNFKALLGKAATLTFWVKGTKAGIHCVSFKGAASTRSYVAEYTINVTDTWEKKTIPITFDEATGSWDTTDGTGLEVVFTLSCGTTYQTTKDAWQTGNFFATSSQVNATSSTAFNFRLSQIQLEVGDTATDFECRSIGEELALCLRYFERLFGDAAITSVAIMTGRSTAVASGVIPYTKKRIVPAFTVNGSGWNLLGLGGEVFSSLVMSEASTVMAQATWNDAGTPLLVRNSYVMNTGSTSDYIDIDSEL